MKKQILLYILVLPLSICAQNDFEGIITYKGTSTSGINKYEIKMFFSDKKMKVALVGNDLSDPEMNKLEIYNFKTGIHYKILKDEKTFSIDSLDNYSTLDNNNALKDTSLHEIILGNKCQAYVAVPGSDAFFPKNFLSLFWLADSIKFTVPDNYRNKRGIETLPDGNMIFLKLQVFVNFPIDDDEEEDILKTKSDTFLLIAQKIERVKLNETDFLPPADYTFSAYERSVSRDSVRVRVKELTLTELKQEEVIKPEPPPPPPPKPTKSPAKKTKQTKPVKG